MELDIMYLQASQNSALGGFTFFCVEGFFFGELYLNEFQRKMLTSITCCFYLKKKCLSLRHNLVWKPGLNLKQQGSE